MWSKCSVSMSGFSDASVSISGVVTTTGRTQVFLVENTILTGQYSSVLGGVSHHVESTLY